MTGKEALALLKENPRALSNADLSGANFNGANLSGVNMMFANLTDASFVEANLFGANFSRTLLEGADLTRANLTWVNLSLANLTEANLSEANLLGANLTRSSLNGTSLTGAKLHETNLTKALLYETQLSGAALWNTLFTYVDISKVLGLETVIHEGPSSIGIDTIFLSKGKIPDVFLRGCGVPESTIANFKAIVGSLEPIQFYSCFISYSSKDSAFANRLYGRLRDYGLRIWYAPEDMRGGKKNHDQIDDAIRMHDKLIILLSPHSMNSEWVQKEIFNARKRERAEGKRILFPIRLCSIDEINGWKCHYGSDPKELADEVREYHIPDFTQWKNHDKFENEFAKLIDALKHDTLLTNL